MTHQRYDIFISYSRKDIEIADKICTALEGAGISCFIDREGISTGEDFVNKITHNIENSQFFLFLASKNAYEAKFTPKEVLYAIDYKPKESIIPYIIDNSPIDKKYKFLISDINYQTMEQCPIEPSLVDDILKRLGRERRCNSITNDYLLSLPDDEFEIFELKGKCGYILKSSDKFEIVIPNLYDTAFPFCDGLAKVEIGDKYGFINKIGKEITPLKYDNAKSFNEGLTRVKLNGKYGFIDKTGKEVTPLKYNDAESFYEGLARVMLNWRYGFVDKTGKEITPLKYDDAESFSEGLARVKLNGKYGFIDTFGNEVIPLKYVRAKSYREDLAVVKLNGKWGFIDKTGKEVIPCKYDGAWDFSEGLAQVRLNMKFGFIDKSGQMVIPLKLDWWDLGFSCMFLCSAFGFLILLLSLFGFIDIDLKEIIEYYYKIHLKIFIK